MSDPIPNLHSESTVVERLLDITSKGHDPDALWRLIRIDRMEVALEVLKDLERQAGGLGEPESTRLAMATLRGRYHQALLAAWAPKG